MPNFICITCGTQFAESEQPSAVCPICEDERQFVGWEGQQWTTLPELQASHRHVVLLKEPGLYGIGMEPRFAIGQRALLITHPEGNVLWDCIPLLDDTLVEMIQGIGGISAIAISQGPGPDRPLCQCPPEVSKVIVLSTIPSHTVTGWLHPEDGDRL